MASLQIFVEDATVDEGVRSAIGKGLDLRRIPFDISTNVIAMEEWSGDVRLLHIM